MSSSRNALALGDRYRAELSIIHTAIKYQDNKGYENVLTVASNFKLSKVINSDTLMQTTWLIFKK